MEETSYEIAEKNGIGQKSKNNGVLLFVVMNDRKMRIEVGYGLEGALPDALAGQIIRKEITPYFKQAKYYEGINAGVDAIISATKGEYTQDKKYSEKEENDFGVGCCGVPILVLVIFGFFGFFFITSILRRIFGWGRGKGRSNWWNSGGWTSGQRKLMVERKFVRRILGRGRLIRRRRRQRQLVNIISPQRAQRTQREIL